MKFAEVLAGLWARERIAGIVVLAVFALAASTMQWFNPLQTALLDAEHRLLARYFAKTAKQDVAIVGIDEATVRAYPEPLALWHAYIGAFLEAVATTQPAAVGLDIVLPDRSFDGVLPDSDKRLMQGLLAMRQGGRLVVGLTVDESGAPRSIYPPFVSVAGPDALGYVLLPLDADNMTRRVSERMGVPSRQVPTLVGQMMRKMGRQSGEGFIDYALGPQRGYIPLQQVLAWKASNDEASLRAAFAGKPVLLGSVLPFEDRYFQPVNLAGWESANGNSVPGVLIHAQALKSMLNGGPIAPAPAVLNIVLAVLMSLLWLPRLRLAAATALAAGVVAILFAAGTVLLHGGIYLSVTAAAITGVIAIAGRWLAGSLIQLRERMLLRRAFSGYVSPPVMEEILQGRLADELGGNTRKVCIMFADVRGFTTFSETMPPQKVIELLNRYFELVMHAIHAEGGTINSIMGDGLMAIFGAPQALDNPCERAVAAARGMLTALPLLNEELRSEGKPPLTIGIGLNYGEAIVGHVGSAGRHDYSAIGDTTNLAARLEGLTKTLGYPLACTKAVVDMLAKSEEFVSTGQQNIKGRSAVEVFGWPAH